MSNVLYIFVRFYEGKEIGEKYTYLPVYNPIFPIILRSRSLRKVEVAQPGFYGNLSTIKLFFSTKVGWYDGQTI